MDTTPKVEARPYQQRIVAKAVDYFAGRGARSVLIESPTGSGKTVMGMMVARELQQRLGVRVGWVAMRRYLLAQAAAENQERGLGVEATFLSMFDKEPPTGLDLLVVDEAQHDGASSMAHLHNVIRPRYILGLSATPFRADKVKLCFDAVIRDAGIHRLIQEGFLSPFHHYTLPEYSPRSVAECYCKDRKRWGKSIFYFHTLEQCHEAARLIRARRVRCDVVTGSSDRDAQIDAFRRGKLDVLINCVVLAEGFDCPELKTVFCRPSCKGITVQMCGRVFRKHVDVPVKQIVQCTRTRWPFQRTASAELQFVWTDGDWRTLTVNPLIDQVAGRTLRLLAQTEVTLPQYLVRRGVRRRDFERFQR